MKFDQFQEKFISMDPYHTGFITAEEFSDILKDTCDELEDVDAEEICKAYDTNHDDRVNYIDDHFDDSVDNGDDHTSPDILLSTGSRVRREPTVCP